MVDTVVETNSETKTGATDALPESGEVKSEETINNTPFYASALDESGDIIKIQFFSNKDQKHQMQKFDYLPLVVDDKLKPGDVFTVHNEPDDQKPRIDFHYMVVKMPPTAKNEQGPASNTFSNNIYLKKINENVYDAVVSGKLRNTNLVKVNQKKVALGTGISDSGIYRDARRKESGASAPFGHNDVNVIVSQNPKEALQSLVVEIAEE